MGIENRRMEATCAVIGEISAGDGSGAKNATIGDVQCCDGSMSYYSRGYSSILKSRLVVQR